MHSRTAVCATESIDRWIGVGLRGGEVWPAHAYLSSMPAFSRPLSSEKNEPLFDTFPQPRLEPRSHSQTNGAVLLEAHV